ncbi:MAG: FosX/FosE/FosI family fosfomycin resistance hydrolase [Candidatus Saccharibacteria bacterium]
MIVGISHLTFIVKDLEYSAEFFKSIFDAEEIYDSGEKTFSIAREKYLSIGGLWICIMEGEPLAEPTYNHIAFRIADEEFELYEARIKGLGVEIRPSRPRVEGEGRSLYFYDYDNHLFELHTGSLSERLAAYTL